MSGTFWTSQTIEYAVSGPNGVRQGSLSHPFALVGSSQACDVRIDGDKIASRALLAMVTPAGIRAIVLTPGTKKSGRVIQVAPDRPLKLHDHQLSLTVTGAADVNLPDDESEETLFALTWQSGKNRQFL